MAGEERSVTICATQAVPGTARRPGGCRWRTHSVRHKETGAELFRHIEDGGDDEDHLLRGIEHDLASMTADEFTAAWR